MDCKTYYEQVRGRTNVGGSDRSRWLEEGQTGNRGVLVLVRALFCSMCLAVYLWACWGYVPSLFAAGKAWGHNSEPCICGGQKGFWDSFCCSWLPIVFSRSHSCREELLGSATCCRQDSLLLFFLMLYLLPYLTASGLCLGRGSESWHLSTVSMLLMKVHLSALTEHLKIELF